MEDMSPEIDPSAVPNAIAALLGDHKGGEVLMLDLREIEPPAWTDFFIIATATSDAHLDGLERHVKDFCAERGIEILRRSRRPDGEDEWRIIDLGTTVIHLFSRRAREFYDLERLYSMARTAPQQPLA